MDFRLSDEQKLLQDSVGRFIAGEYTMEKRRAFMKLAGGVKVSG